MVLPDWVWYNTKSTGVGKSKYKIRYYFIGSTFIFSYSNELMQWRSVRRLSVGLCPSVNFLRKSLFLADKWPDRHQTCTRWSPGEPASSVLKVKVKGQRSKVT